MKKSLLADLSLLCVALIWGTTFVVVQKAISSLEPHSFNGLRFTLAFLLLGGWIILFAKEQWKHLNKKIILSGIFIGLWLFVGYSFQTIGLLYTTPSKAGFITGLSVVLVPLFSILILKQKLKINGLIGVFLATVGLYLLTMSGSSSVSIGDLYVFICAIGFALHIIFTGKFTLQFPTLLLTVIQIGTVALLSFIFAFFTEDMTKITDTSVLFKSNVLVGLIVTSVLATALAFFIQTKYQKYTTPTRVALIFATEPVFSAITAYFWIKETLSFESFIGCVFIFTGMILSEVPLNFKKKVSTPCSKKIV